MKNKLCIKNVRIVKVLTINFHSSNSYNLYISISFVVDFFAKHQMQDSCSNALIEMFLLRILDKK